jgi:hypothetical protein
MRFLANATLALIGDAVGLIVAAVLLDHMTLDAASFWLALVIFTVAFFVLQPLAVKITLQHSSALAGGSALVATLASLIITDLLADGLSISGFGTWVLATVIVWGASLLAGVVLPLFLFKKTLARTGGGVRGSRTTTWR